jgi:hypothetical protein
LSLLLRLLQLRLLQFLHLLPHSTPPNPSLIASSGLTKNKKRLGNELAKCKTPRRRMYLAFLPSHALFCLLVGSNPT